MMLRFYIILMILALHLKAFSGITYPIDIHDGQVIESCSGYFTDSSGDTLSRYSSNENYTITFTSSDAATPYLSMEFLFLHLGPGDYLRIYDGESADGELLYEVTEGDDPRGEIIYSSTDSLHFHFISSPSEHGFGWFLEINCHDACDLFTADFYTELETMKFCPEVGVVSLFVEGYYKVDHIDFDDNLIDYIWTYDGTTHTGSQLDYDFNDPGAYPFRIYIYEPENSCEFEIHEAVFVGKIPYFKGTYPSKDTLCAEEDLILTGKANMVEWTSFDYKVKDTVAIPDGTGESYESVLEFDVFPDSYIIESAEDFAEVCITLDHVDQSQLNIEIECPDGLSILLKDFGGSSANLGEPVVYNDTLPGVGYEYCFTPTSQYGLLREAIPQYYDYTDRAGNYYANEAYLVAGDYLPEESFDEIVGCPLNGEWLITITDDTSGENGFIHSWTISFNDKFYDDSIRFTPEVVHETWYDEGTDLHSNPAITTKEQDGDYEFEFEITDNFNCTYDTTVTAHFLPLPEAEIESFIELPLCEGDSTLLRILPIDNDGYHWVYEWIFNNDTLENEIYDRLVVKEAGTYTALITDTILGCTAEIDKEVTYENCDLNIPNVFTPNYDGINDYFEIENLEHYEYGHIIIYNRWGNIVFEHTDYYGNWWDGRGQPDGVYYYVLLYRRMGEEQQLNGVVHIMR